MKHCNIPNLIQKAFCTYTNTTDNHTYKEVQQTYRDHTEAQQKYRDHTEAQQTYKDHTQRYNRSTEQSKTIKQCRIRQVHFNQ